MTFDERVQLFLSGFTGPVLVAEGNADDVLRGRVEALAEGRVFDLTTDRLAVAGYVHGLSDAALASPVWTAGPAADFLVQMSGIVDELSEAAAADSGVVDLPELLDFFVARWGAGGQASLSALEEIIRRARNRQAGARDLLAVASHHPLVRVVYERLGFDVAGLPEPEPAAAGTPGMTIDPRATPETAMSSSSPTSTLAGSGDSGQMSASLEPASVDLASPAPAGPPDPAGSGPPIVWGGAGGGVVSADFDLGKVCVSKVPVSLQITAALGLSVSLVAAVRLLLIPAEGYRWLDDTGDPLASSSLLVEDPELAHGLPLVDPETQPGGPWLHGDVRQAGTQDEGTGQYRCRIYTRGVGFVEFAGDLLDIHEAKFALASAVRTQLVG